MMIQQIDKQYVANTYNRFPVAIVKGKGAECWDADGKRYIDMGTGIGVTAFGYCDEQWTAAVTAQATKLQHTSNLYYTEPCAQLAKLLCEKTGMKKVFFSNSGAEANECAIKVARKYSAQKKGADCFTIVTLKQSFHGRTLTTLAATGQDHFHQDFLPLTPGFAHVEANNIDELNAAVNETTAGIMIEIVQGEGGVNPLTREFVAECARLAKEKDIPLIVDEVQTGNGRTGYFYAYQAFGIEPDIVSTAKGLGGGLPIGATMLGEKVKDLFTPGLNGTTFGGNPVCAAGALSIIDRIDDTLLQEVRKKSEYIFTEIKNTKGVKSVSGMGLMIGVETEKDATQIVNECMEKGVLVIKAKHKVRLLPALNIPFEQLKKAIEILKEVIEK